MQSIIRESSKYPFTAKHAGILFFFPCFFISIASFSQDCTPIKERITFGSGPNPGTEITEVTTSRGFWNKADLCPEDGRYSIVNKLKPDCFLDDENIPTKTAPAWHVVDKDHTKKPSGYMVLLNTPGYLKTGGYKFFSKTFTNICPGNIYTVEIFVMNVKRDMTRGDSPRPLIEVTGALDKLLKAEKSEAKNDLKPTVDTVWVRRALSFNSGTNTSITLNIVDYSSHNSKGCDFVLDDVSLIGPRSVIPTQTSISEVEIITGDTTTVEEPETPIENKVFIPNAFSPNGDGINDVWDLSALNLYFKSTVSVFNRFGKTVYKTSGNMQNWDGTTNGRPLPTGVYYYVIDIPEEKKKLSGWLLLVQ